MIQWLKYFYLLHVLSYYILILLKAYISLPGIFIQEKFEIIVLRYVKELNKIEHLLSLKVCVLFYSPSTKYFYPIPKQNMSHILQDLYMRGPRLLTLKIIKIGDGLIKFAADMGILSLHLGKKNTQEKHG